jgi:hypothetical protein
MHQSETTDEEESHWEHVLDVCVFASMCLILCIMLVVLAMGLVFGLVAWVKFAWRYA